MNCEGTRQFLLAVEVCEERCRGGYPAPRERTHGKPDELEDGQAGELKVGRQGHEEDQEAGEEQADSSE